MKSWKTLSSIICDSHKLGSTMTVIVVVTQVLFSNLPRCGRSNDKSILSHLTFVTNIALFPYSKFGSRGRLDLYTLPTYFLSSNLSYIHFQMTESWWLKCPMICNDSGWTIHKLDETQRCWMTISSLSPTYLSIISYTCMPLL